MKVLVIPYGVFWGKSRISWGGGGGGKGGNYSSLKLFYPPEVGSPEFNFVQVINPPKPN